jgi:hypothetical protein
VRDHGELHGLDVLGRQRAALVGGHQVRHAQHRHLVDRLEAAEAGAVGRVADVGVRLDLRRHRRRCAERDLTGARDRERLALGLLDGDQLRLLAHHGRDVVGAALGGHVVERLDRLPALLHDELEGVVTLLAGGRDLDGQVVGLR